MFCNRFHHLIVHLMQLSKFRAIHKDRIYQNQMQKNMTPETSLETKFNYIENWWWLFRWTFTSNGSMSKIHFQTIFFFIHSLSCVAFRLLVSVYGSVCFWNFLNLISVRRHKRLNIQRIHEMNWKMELNFLVISIHFKDQVMSFSQLNSLSCSFFVCFSLSLVR